MKRAIVVIGVSMLGTMLFLSCAEKTTTCTPSSEADILVLTQPAGMVPGNISAIDTSTGNVCDDILPGGTGEIPNEFLLKGTTLWIVNSAQASIQSVQVSENNGKLVLSTLGRVYLLIGSSPEYMEFIGDTAYVTLYSEDNIMKVDTVKNQTIGGITLPTFNGCSSLYQGFSPWGIAVSGTTLLVAGTGVSPGVLAWINSTTGSMEFTALTSRANANSIIVDAASNLILVTTSDWCDSMNGALDVFSATTGQMVSSVAVGVPLGAVSFINGKAYIADLTGPRLQIVDINLNKLKTPLALSSNPGIGFITGVRVNPQNGLVYAGGWGMQGGEVYEIEPTTDTVRKIYAIKGPAQDISFRK